MGAFFFFSSTGALGKGFDAGEESFVEVTPNSVGAKGVVGTILMDKQYGGFS